MGNRITFDEICQQLCSIYRVTLCCFQNEVQMIAHNYLRTIRYSRSTIHITISTYHEKIGQTIENL